MKSRSLSNVQSSTSQWALSDISIEDKRTLEQKWDGRHHRNYQLLNDTFHPCFRDYFDRKRELDDESQPGVKAAKRMLPTWSNNCPELEDEVDSRPGRPPVDRHASVEEQRENGWNGRHGVTHSGGNHRYHDSEREYFGRCVAPRSKRVISQRVHGITKHQLPHKMHGVPDGVDDDTPPAEVFLAGLSAPPRPKRSGSGLLPRLSKGLSPSASAPTLGPSGSTTGAAIDAMSA